VGLQQEVKGNVGLELKVKGHVDLEKGQRS
jgi:hypothetical protein